MTSLRRLIYRTSTRAAKRLSYFAQSSKDAGATQHPARRRLHSVEQQAARIETAKVPHPKRDDELVLLSISRSAGYEPKALDTTTVELKEQHFTIFYGDTGHSYEGIMGPYLRGAKQVVIEDPYIRLPHQISEFCALL